MTLLLARSIVAVSAVELGMELVADPPLLRLQFDNPVVPLALTSDHKPELGNRQK